MADYKTIHGTTVKNYTNDPDNPIEGQVWYDETAATLQYQIPNVTTAGSWRTGNAMNTARGISAGAGTQTAGIVFGGKTPPNSYVGNTEFYDGTSWTEQGDLNTSRYESAAAKAGTQTASLCIGGATSGPDNYYAVCETFDGTSWTEVGDLNTGTPGRYGMGGSGTTTSALVFGGYFTPPAQRTDATESWNGSAWTEVAYLKNERTG